MHHLSRTAIASALLALCASAQAQASATLAQVFSDDMIGANLSYFESVAGVARSSLGDEHSYQVEGCDITANASGDVISSLRLQLSPACKIDLSQNIGSFAPAAGQPLTVGSFARSSGGELDYYADCLSDCGNAGDPSFYAYWQGPHAVGFLEVMLEVALVDGAALDAKGRWADDMQKARGEDWMSASQFNCDHSFNAQAAQYFDQVAVTAVTIGTELGTPGCN